MSGLISCLELRSVNKHSNGMQTVSFKVDTDRESNPCVVPNLAKLLCASTHLDVFIEDNDGI